LRAPRSILVKREAKPSAKSAASARPSGPRRTRTLRRPETRHAARSDSDRNRPLALAVLGQFRMIFRSTKKHFQWVQERTGVSGAQLWVLAELHSRPGIRVTDLARAMGVHQSTASNLIDPLEKRGLIQRDRSRQDQRVVHLSLTRSGRGTVARAPLPLVGVLPDALNSLEHADLVELQRRLEKLAKRMKVRDRAGKRIPIGEI
jgi:MarR family transcriptional regulator, organic hydroperoxide resistance regulator